MSAAPAGAGNRIFIGLTVAVLAAPLPLGANRMWSWSLLALAVALLLVAWSVACLRGRSQVALGPERLWLPALPFCLALLWGLLQTLPVLPQSWAHPLWADAAAALGRPLPLTVSPDPDGGRNAVLRLLAYGGVFLLAAQLGRRGQRAAWALKAAALALVAYSVHALATHALGVERLLWIPKWAYVGDATGTFVGRAAFGAFAGIGVLLCLAHAVAALQPAWPGMRRSERIERFLQTGAPWLAGALVALLAVLASHSRGALLATGLGCAVLLAACTIGRLVKVRHAAVLTLVVAVLAGGALVLGGQVTLKRMAGEGDMIGDRPNLLRLTVTAIGDAPLRGHGLGAFLDAFRPYRDLTFPRDVIYDYAHNTWAETIMELGWPAGLCLLAAPTLAVAVCAWGLRRRQRNQIYPAMAVAVAALLGAQGLVDFTVQIPALAALLAYLLGIGYAQAWPTR